MTYAPGSFRGDRTPISPPDLLAKIQYEARPGAGSHTIGLIMPSTFHKLQVRNQDLPAGAAMFLYCGIADLDAEPRHAGSKKALKQAIQTGIQSGMTWGELSEARLCRRRDGCQGALRAAARKGVYSELLVHGRQGCKGLPRRLVGPRVLYAVQEERRRRIKPRA